MIFSRRILGLAAMVVPSALGSTNASESYESACTSNIDSSRHYSSSSEDADLHEFENNEFFAIESETYGIYHFLSYRAVQSNKETGTVVALEYDSRFGRFKSNTNLRTIAIDNKRVWEKENLMLRIGDRVLYKENIEDEKPLEGDIIKFNYDSKNGGAKFQIRCEDSETCYLTTSSNCVYCGTQLDMCWFLVQKERLCKDCQSCYYKKGSVLANVDADGGYYRRIKFHQFAGDKIELLYDSFDEGFMDEEDDDEEVEIIIMSGDKYRLTEIFWKGEEILFHRPCDYSKDLHATIVEIGENIVLEYSHNGQKEKISNAEIDVQELGIKKYFEICELCNAKVLHDTLESIEYVIRDEVSSYKTTRKCCKTCCSDSDSEVDCTRRRRLGVVNNLGATEMHSNDTAIRRHRLMARLSYAY